MAQQILQFPKPILSSTLDEPIEENDTFDSEIREDIIKLGRVNAPTCEIADHVSKQSGQHFTTTDIRNRLNKYNAEIHGYESNNNDYFNDLITESGSVLAKYDKNRSVRVLLIQTKTKLKAFS